MLDLSVLFEKGIYYDIRQRGHYSLKTMMNLFSDQDGYSKLPLRMDWMQLKHIEGFAQVMMRRKETRWQNGSIRIVQWIPRRK